MPATNVEGLGAAWAGLRSRTEQRLKTLNEEISRYPGPIARCDEHLAALIDSRAALFALLQRIDGLAGAVGEIEALLGAETEDAAAGGGVHELEAS